MTPVDALVLAPAAFLAGVLMFLAPCTLPIVPGYLAFIAGAGASRRRLLCNAFAFVIGFSIVFILLGLFAAFVGGVLGPWRSALARASGLIIILFGLTMLGVVRVSVLANEKRFHIPHFLALGRPESSLLIGVLFALGWSPCVGPILGTILLFASTSATALQGALLLGIFSLGLGLPFVATALLLDQASSLFARHSRLAHVLSIGGGVVLVGVGVLMLLGQMALLVSWGYSFFDFLGYNKLLNYL